MRVCGLPVLSAASLSETERGAGGADTADPSSTATAAQPMRVGSAASAAGAPAQTTPSDCKLGANLSRNALGEDVTASLGQNVGPECSAAASLSQNVGSRGGVLVWDPYVAVPLLQALALRR
ncbi:hypothetical protein EMIHUDRAFT_222073 [Emiliania huxleyi CCMP1516]|uniref:Uncharacterized protein n=2 Tax=Emiliania huxleyi TaxID=2903 RepID=A0A0D3KZ39_EMIH1|nr:hypothetical protein EMIHUDRAFT_222073 [Emiliania huxleyi CCMP1516]EOD41024.1 hypothetical protein EMIHUDRAFT_222073 [Emiliania huxleyi CCMP1516]|eukprot:XP_005793453.1 hypothetical protein EMIHUDRAFT_222073 [Emiliania huxleyi CCMP1516]